MALAPQLGRELALAPSTRPDYLASAPMTFEEYLDWEHEGGLVEWVAGTSYAYMSASYQHQEIVGFLGFVLRGWAETTRAGSVIAAPYAMQSGAGRPGREPDLMFIAAANQDRLQPRFLAGAPDLVVEVISSDSVARDMETKRGEYAAAGIREYWLIESREPFRWAKFLVLRDGEYVEVPVVDGVYRSEVAEGFWLRTDWLWDADLRSVDALQEILERQPRRPAAK